jgi:NADH-quinone oxidoreductase subunit C
MRINDVLPRLKQVAGPDGICLTTIADEIVYAPPIEKWLDVVRFLTGECGIFYLSAITVQQRAEKQDEVEVMYHFWDGEGITFIFFLPATQPEILSIVSIIPGADYYEREAAEMFGIVFLGREKTPHLLLPDDWADGPPFVKGGSDA